MFTTFIGIGRQRHLGFIFLIGRITEVRIPDVNILIELTALELLQVPISLIHYGVNNMTHSSLREGVK